MKIIILMNKFTAISLFSGIGGIDLAAYRAGFDILAQVEIDPFCRKILAKHAPQYWPNAVQFEDVKSVGKHNLPAADVIFGGFPCQPTSNAGARKGQEDARWLWPEFARIIGEIRPRFILLENVPGICNPIKDKQGNIIYAAPSIDVVTDLTAMGYDAEWCLVSASATGAPHKRERWFCVGYPSSIAVNISEGSKRECLPDALCSIENVGYADCQRCQDQGDDQQWISATPNEDRENNFSINAARGDNESRMGRILDGLPGRLDKVRRSSRFPAGQGNYQHEWEAPRTAPKGKHHKDRIKALGNAVVPQVVYPFMQIIYNALQAENAL